MLDGSEGFSTAFEEFPGSFIHDAMEALALVNDLCWKPDRENVTLLVTFS